MPLAVWLHEDIKEGAKASNGACLCNLAARVLIWEVKITDSASESRLRVLSETDKIASTRKIIQFRWFKVFLVIL